MKNRYINPWTKEIVTHDLKPRIYKNCLIFRRGKKYFETVKNGVCITQRCGLLGAKLVADAVEHLDAPTLDDVSKNMLKKFGHY